MNERPNPDDEPVLPEDPAPGRDPDPSPRPPKGRKKAQVTPLDEDEHIKDGIEVKET